MSASKTALEYRQAHSGTDYPWLLTVLQSCMACKGPNTFSGSLRRVCQPRCVMLISSLSKSAWHTVMMFFSKFLLPGRPWVLPTLLSFAFSRSVVSASLRPPGLQHTRPPWPSPFPELAETHIHWVGDAIQPSRPLASPSPPAFNPSHIRVFSNESVLLIRWPKYQSFSIYPHYGHLILPMPGGSGIVLLATGQKSLRF